MDSKYRCMKFPTKQVTLDYYIHNRRDYDKTNTLILIILLSLFFLGMITLIFYKN